LFRALGDSPEIEPLTCSLSIATFRYAPPGLRTGTAADEEYLNGLNTELLAGLQAGGQAYPSNAVVAGKFALRVCVVNFRSTLDDMLALPPLVTAAGRDLHSRMRGTTP
jgi:glutamate/tyrosine decarboxylase-like PLP-dependent enzyme